jgi:hypothetical protein
MNPPPVVANAAVNQRLDNASAGPPNSNAMTRVGQASKRAKLAMDIHGSMGGDLVTTEEVGQQVAHATREAVAASMNVDGAPGILAAI